MQKLVRFLSILECRSKIVNKEEYCGKILFFAKGKKCSWHYHKLKDEVFYIRKGKLLVKYGYDEDLSKAEEVVLDEGDNFYVKTLAFYDASVLFI